MNIVSSLNSSTSERSTSTGDTPDIVIENSESFCSDDEMVKDTVISGNSILSPHKETANKNESATTTDIENLSWCKIKTEAITSTPHIVSEENLSMIYKPIDIPQDIDFIEIELCCSISATQFYAQLQENVHCPSLSLQYSLFIDLMSNLQEETCKQSLIKNFVPNTPCIAKYHDGLWYRCIIAESEPVEGSDETEIKLVYVDYGNHEYRTVNNSEKCELYALKKEWMDVPTMAMKCKLWNVEISPTADYKILLPQLKEMYSKCVIATIKDTDDEFISIEIFKDYECEELMYNTLIEEGLFQLTVKEN